MDENKNKNVFTSFNQLEWFVTDMRRFADRYKKCSSTGLFFESDVCRQCILDLCAGAFVCLKEIQESYRRPIDKQISVSDLNIKKEF